MANQLSVLKEKGIALKQGQIDDAQRCYTLALAAERETSDSMLLRRQIQQNLTLCAVKREAWQECVDLCTTLISQGSGEVAKVQYRMGLALSKLGRKLDAFGHIVQARNLEPADKAIKQLMDSLRMELHVQTTPGPQGMVQVLTLMAVHSA